MGKLRVYCLKTLNKLSVYPLGNTPSAPSVTSVNTDEMAFFNEFTNADMGPGGGNDVVMNSDNTTKENFVV